MTSDVDKFAFTATAGKRHYFDFTSDVSDIFVKIVDGLGKIVLTDTITENGIYYLDATENTVYDVHVSANYFRSTGDYSFYFTDNLGKAVFSNPTYSGDLIVGSEIVTSISVYDADGNSDNEIATVWYLGDGDLTNGVEILGDYSSWNGQLTLEADWAGKTLYYSKAFEDDAGNTESSLDLSTVTSGDMSTAQGIYKVGVIAPLNATTHYSVPASGGNITHTGGGATVDAYVDVSTSSDAIYVANTGTGSTTITAQGTFQGGVGQTDQTKNIDGIYAWNDPTTTDLSITLLQDTKTFGTTTINWDSSITGVDDGIQAVNYGTGFLSISVTGDVTSTSTDTSDADNSHGL